jgi:hypothetical protein
MSQLNKKFQIQIVNSDFKLNKILWGLPNGKIGAGVATGQRISRELRWRRKAGLTRRRRPAESESRSAASP